MLQAAVDPQPVKFFLDAVLRQAAVQCREIDAVHLLVLVKAGGHHGLGAGPPDRLHKQALDRVERRELMVTRCNARTSS